MKIIIAGAGGFIGKNLLLSLAERHQVLALDRTPAAAAFVRERGLSGVDAVSCDLQDSAALSRLARRWDGKADAAVYLAGNGDPAFSVENPGRDLSDGPLALIRFLSHFRIGRLIYFSSGAVYDGLSGLVSPSSRLDPRLPYAIAKLASEGYVKFFQKQGSVRDYVIVRFFGAYGPQEPPRKIYTKLVRTFALEKEREFVIRGDGKNLIDAMFVSDTVEAVKMMLASRGRYITVDLCVGRPYTLRALVEEAARTFGVKARIRCVGKVPEYISFRPRPTAMKKLYGFAPRVKLSEGLKILRDHLVGETANAILR
jgi:nucleoside-diphosphate-sugar epimerase